MGVLTILGVIGMDSVALVVGCIISIVLLVKFWMLCNDVREIKEHLKQNKTNGD